MNNQNDLLELNTILFDTLRGVKDGTIKNKKAETITRVDSAIISTNKVQLQAYKLTKGVAYKETFGRPSNSALESGDQYEQMNEYAMIKGYKSVSNAKERT